MQPAIASVVAPRTDAVFFTYLGGAMGLLALGTVIAAAFAVGARRQLHTIGLLSSTGGPRRRRSGGS